eukprot:PhF_6_TR5244/c0_g1_i1/m.7607
MKEGGFSNNTLTKTTNGHLCLHKLVTSIIICAFPCTVKGQLQHDSSNPRMILYLCIMTKRIVSTINQICFPPKIIRKQKKRNQQTGATREQVLQVVIQK